MKSILISFICFLYVNSTKAQNNENQFMGAITIKGGATYPYKLQFTDTNGKIKGYSVTDIKGADETRTAITGSINANKREFRFRETYIISTKSKISKNDFCFISAKLKLSEKKDTKVLKGHFTGYRPDGKTSCGKGNIMLVCTDDFLAKLMPAIDTLDTAKQAMIKEVIKEYTTEEDVYDPKKVWYVIPGGTEELKLKARNIELEVWDNEKIDGDVVTVKLNNKILLDHYSLVAAHKKISFTIQSDTVNTLELIANNEGSEPTNTMRMILRDGDREYQVQAGATLSKSARIVLKSE